jgi:tetratricopeptide (TPR) repeat protein
MATELQGGSLMEHPTLNLVDHLLAAAGRCQEQGRFRDALRLLTRVADFRQLPAAAAEQTQARLAELQLKRRKFGRARRHLAAALQHSPDDARYHYWMASALVHDTDGDLDRAADHYRRSLELDPGQTKCRSEYGLVMVRLGQTELGLELLRQAVEQAPDDADATAKLAKGLRLLGRGAEAAAALRAGLFRNPRAPRFRKLWNEYHFSQLRQRQNQGRERRAERRREDAPVILPFVRLDRPHASAGTGGDGDPATVQAPHRRLGRDPQAGSEQRHVQ